MSRIDFAGASVDALESLAALGEGALAALASGVIAVICQKMTESEAMTSSAELKSISNVVLLKSCYAALTSLIVEASKVDAGSDQVSVLAHMCVHLNA